MGNTAKKAVRKVLKGKVLRAVETEYRLARASFVNAKFQWPARGMRVIMITGTNGKTTTAHFMFSILRSAGYKVGLASTAEVKINEQTERNDTNMTVLNPSKIQALLAKFKAHQVDFVILEATSQALDQHRLWGIPCEVAIFTNLSQDHLDYHKTMENYAAAKAKLWELKPKLSVLNADDSYHDYYAKVATGKVLNYGKKTGDVKFSDYEPSKIDARFCLRLPGGKQMVKIHLSGEYNVYNAVAAATAAYGLGINPEQIEEGLEALEHLPGRLELVDIKKPFQVLVDYAHTPDGLEKLLTAARDMTKGQLWLVFGSCGDRDKGKRPIMGRIAAKLADRIVITDEESYSEDPAQIIAAIKQGVDEVKGGSAKTTELLDRREAIKHAMQNAKKGDLILVTGLGHEQFRIQNGKKTPWSDPEVIKKLAKK